MDYDECQHYANCGGWCESPEEVAMNLCAECLDGYREDEAKARYVAELEDAMRRIAAAVGIAPAQPATVADIVCARLAGGRK